MKWKGIAFDLDNTLFSHEKAFKQAIEECYLTYLGKHVLKKEHVPYQQFFPVFKQNSDSFWGKFEKKEVSGDEYRRLRFNESMKFLKLPYGDELADEFHAYYYNIVDEYSEPFTGLHELLSYIDKKGIPMAIITNGTTDTQYKKVEKIGASKWIPSDNIIVSEEVGYSKPAREIFRIAEKKLGLTAEEMLFIGDSWDHDVIGAKKAGWEVIYLNSREEVSCKDVHPYAEVKTMEECKREIMNMF
ncbi:HAD family hydrolase [Salipaludibacillus sp. CF4.18]|uniref:HAD family hydrolase n=1 Tax=Salipaludibacillus sp. CF4.18 TaxID=3373081 RepID=UPI003EE5DBAF